MVEESRTEAHGWALVASLETFRGFSIQMTSRQSGFNGLSISKHGHVRKIELKAIKRTDKSHGSLKFLVYSQIRLYNILWFMLQNDISKQNGKVFSDPSCVPMIDPTQYVVVKFRFRSKNKRTVSFGINVVHY